MRSGILCIFLLAAVYTSDVLVVPTQTSKPHIGFVLIQGASIPADRYVPLAKSVQELMKEEYSVFVGMPSFLLDTPNPLTISAQITSLLSQMQAAGMKADAPVFVGGHSLGGIVLQNYAKGSAKKFMGQVLMGSFLNRGNVNGTTPYPLSTLTIGGEKDGLGRISRIMESAVYFKNLPDTFPVITLQGVTHMQFASGVPPPNVKKNDLKPEISDDEAHEAIAQCISAYFVAILEGDYSSLRSLQQTSNDQFLKPWEDAFQLQGYYHIKPPCYCSDLFCPETDSCRGGSDWVSKNAQRIMADLTSKTSLTVTDTFHRVYTMTPAHFPGIENACSDPDGCHLKSNTITENIYSQVDDLFDTGFQPITASQMRCKMVSRQAMWKAAGIKDVNFDTTDGPSICADINKQALQWALDNAASRTLKRYQEVGQLMEMGEDLGPYNAGPLWIWTYMEYDQVASSNGGKMMEVRAPMMKTPVDFAIQTVAGSHYCKLLSPARALEWIYVDSLYANDSIKNSATTE